MGVSEDNMIEILNLGDEYKYIVSTSHNSYEGNYDSDEANYMNHGLDDTNIKSLIELHKKTWSP